MNTNIIKIFTACLLFALANLVFADAIDDATDSDIADLCSNSPANELYKIANKKQNSQQDRRNALMRMVEVSRECAGSSSQRLTQYHQKIITAGHKLLSESEVETRRAAIDCFQYVILQPANVQPSQGSINRGQSISNLALTDSDTHVRLWALEALVTLRGDDALVQSTLQSAATDSEAIIQQTANEMYAELF